VTPHEEREVDALIARAAGERNVPDAGFTEGVIARLPRRRRRGALEGVPWIGISAAAAALSCVGAYDSIDPRSVDSAARALGAMAIDPLAAPCLVAAAAAYAWGLSLAKAASRGPGMAQPGGQATRSTIAGGGVGRFGARR
jgi:hypothetical protein